MTTRANQSVQHSPARLHAARAFLTLLCPHPDKGQMQRYKYILDVLLNSPRAYDMIIFDHTHELPSPYRTRARRGISALQREPGKGTNLHKKEADVTAVLGGCCDIVIEEELRPTREHVDNDIAKITPCKYVWALGQQFELRAPYLFILINDDQNDIAPLAYPARGNFRRTIVCRVEEFKREYEEYYLAGR